MTRIDRDWLRAHPLPPCDSETDKNARGRVLLVGGSMKVPGALMLTGEAALRAGAGKLQMATVRDAALPLGMFMPEAGIIALETDASGEIDGGAAGPALQSSLKGCDTLILGPGMAGGDGDETLLAALLGELDSDGSAVIDAAAIGACRTREHVVRGCGGRVALTPHTGEMAQLTGQDAEWIACHMEEAACAAADRLGAVIALKGPSTVIAAPGGETVCYGGGGPGLATGGSGDVLAGILGGLLAQGAEPWLAAAWAVWVHGEAGALVTARLGGPGLLARELLPAIPELLHSAATRP